jgi:hypothetical protein
MVTESPGGIVPITYPSIPRDTVAGNAHDTETALGNPVAVIPVICAPAFCGLKIAEIVSSKIIGNSNVLFINVLFKM